MTAAAYDGLQLAGIGNRADDPDVSGGGAEAQMAHRHSGMGRQKREQAPLQFAIGEEQIVRLI